MDCCTAFIPSKIQEGDSEWYCNDNSRINAFSSANFSRHAYEVESVTRLPVVLMGLGLVLIPIRRGGNVLWALGFALVLFAAAIIIMTCVRERKFTFGSKYVYIPLAVIVASMLLSGGDLGSKLLAVSLFASYVAAVNLKGELKILLPAVVAGCISIVVCNLLDGARTGGMYSLTNYNLAVGAIVMGTVLIKSKYQWILVAVVLAGLLFTGAEEALVALAILGLAVLIRRDWSKKTLLPIGMIVLIALVCIPFGIASQLWGTTSIKVGAALQGDLDTATTGRVDAGKDAITDIRFLGHGYDPYYVKYASIHNVPLRILYELGPLASIAWFFMIAYLIATSKRKYIPVAILALSLFDHFLWTQLSVYQFVAIGIAMRSNEGGDLIFR